MKTILVVEDDKFISNALKIKLEKEGFKVMIAYNGIEGLAILEKNQADLILTDILMPEMDGISMLSRIKEMGMIPRIPTIILTNLDKVSYPEGVREVILKANTNIDVLVQKIKSFIT